LTDPTLSPYYRILNVILPVSTSTNWDAVEPYRRAVESTWLAAYEDAHRKEDSAAIEILKSLRVSLDELAEEKEYDAEMAEYFNGGGSDDEMSMEIQPPITARDTTKTETQAEQMVEEEMKDTAGLEDPLDEGSTAAKDKGKAIAYTILEIRKPADVAGSPSEKHAQE
jgi:hypothetical protein